MPWKQNYTSSDEIAIRDEDIRWPEGVSVAVAITVDLNPATGAIGMDAASVSRPVVQFGLQEGIDHFLHLFARVEAQATFAVPGYFAASYPGIVARIAAAGHEVAVNGLAGEDVRGIGVDEERQRMELARELVAEATGREPAGWFALPRQEDPFASGLTTPDTVRLARECGFAYYGNGLADDAPYYWVTDFDRREALLALPYYYHYDDRFFLMFPEEGTGLERPGALLRNWRAGFAAQYRRGRHFNMTVSPYRSAWGHRLENLATFLAETARMPGVWFASASDIAAHWQAAHPAQSNLRLQPSIWVDYEGSLS